MADEQLSNVPESEKGRLLADLRVNELKSELEKRGLESQGVKIVLTVRLNKALQKEGHDPATYLFTNFLGSQKKTPSKKTPVKRTMTAKSTPNAAAIAEDKNEVASAAAAQKIVDENAENNGKKGKDESIKEGDDDEDTRKENEEEEEEENEDLMIDQDINEEDQIIIDEETEELNQNENDDVDEFDEENEDEEIEDGQDEQEDNLDLQIEDDEMDTSSARQKSISISPTLQQQEEGLLEDPLIEQTIERKNVENASTKNPKQSPSSSSSTMATLEAATRNSAGIMSDETEESKARSVWVRGLTSLTSAASLKQMCMKFGRVQKAKIFNSKKAADVTTCFGYVTFIDKHMAESCVKELNGTKLNEKELLVEIASVSTLLDAMNRNLGSNSVINAATPPSTTTITTTTTTTTKNTSASAPTTVSTSKIRQVTPTKEVPKKPERKRITMDNCDKRDDSKDRKEREARERARRDRKPIIYKTSPIRDSLSGIKRESRSSQRSIGAARSVRAPITNISHHHKPEVVMSKRIDTRNIAIHRSVDRGVSNISTSSLRRGQPLLRTPPTAPFRGPKTMNAGYKPSTGGYKPPTSSSSSSSLVRQRSPLRRKVSRDRTRDRESSSKRDIEELLRKKEEEHRKREEELRLQKEREQIKFEKEKLERERLELELQKQKIALERAAQVLGSRYAAEYQMAQQAPPPQTIIPQSTIVVPQPVPLDARTLDSTSRRGGDRSDRIDRSNRQKDDRRDRSGDRGNRSERNDRNSRGGGDRSDRLNRNDRNIRGDRKEVSRDSRRHESSLSHSSSNRRKADSDMTSPPRRKFNTNDRSRRKDDNSSTVKQESSTSASHRSDGTSHIYGIQSGNSGISAYSAAVLSKEYEMAERASGFNRSSIPSAYASQVTNSFQMPTVAASSTRYLQNYQEPTPLPTWGGLNSAGEVDTSGWNSHTSSSSNGINSRTGGASTQNWPSTNGYNSSSGGGSGGGAGGGGGGSGTTSSRSGRGYEYRSVY